MGLYSYLIETLDFEEEMQKCDCGQNTEKSYSTLVNYVTCPLFY